MINTKIVLISLYIVLIYWISLKLEALHMMFFPSLGAYCLFLFSKQLHTKFIVKIFLGSVFVALISTVMFQLNDGLLSLFCTMLIAVGIIYKFELNAPPILAVAMIPYYIQAPSYWEFPFALSLTLIGLVAVLLLNEGLEKLKVAQLFVNVTKMVTGIKGFSK